MHGSHVTMHNDCMLPGRKAVKNVGFDKRHAAWQRQPVGREVVSTSAAFSLAGHSHSHSHFGLLVTSVLLNWAGGLFLLLRHLSCESKVFSQNLCAKKICWTLTSKSEAEVGGVNTVAAPEVEGAWARPGHALIKLLEFQKQHSHINTTSTQLYLSKAASGSKC